MFEEKRLDLAPMSVWRDFPANAQVVREARRFVASTLRRWQREDLTDDGVLIVSELATNALKVSRIGQEIGVGVHRIKYGITLETRDENSALPTPMSACETAEGGRGLTIVDCLASHWGYRTDGPGKIVYAVLRTDGRSVTS